MLFDEEVAVVNEEAVELRQVLLLCHVSFIMSINYSNNAVDRTNIRRERKQYG